MDTFSDFSKSIDAAARTINRPRALDEVLQTIVEAARTSIPGFDQVGISTVFKNGKVVTRAHQGDLVMRLDEIQYGLGEGPCVETLRGIPMVAAPCLRHDQRWPRWVPEATGLGVQSQLAVHLYLDAEGTIGGLNLYSTTSPDVTQDAEVIAQMFATHASIALGHAREREGLNEALQTRKVIGQAVGILMERYEMPEDQAFAFLVRASSHGNIKLRAVAQELVDERNSV
jgi:GAF domain-containing protein